MRLCVTRVSRGGDWMTASRVLSMQQVPLRMTRSLYVMAAVGMCLLAEVIVCALYISACYT